MVLTKHSMAGVVMTTLLVFFMSGTAFAEGTKVPHKKAIKAMEVHFQNSPKTSPIELSDQTVSSENLHEKDCLYTISEDGQVMGYLLSTSAKGRYDYFDYSIIYSKELEVLGVIVSAYRSTHGAGICQKKWLSQFQGYQGGPLKMGSDIDGVSGGTLSASSMIADMQRCHLLISEAAGH